VNKPDQGAGYSWACREPLRWGGGENEGAEQRESVTVADHERSFMA
jgi:hypothetical protein